MPRRISWPKIKRIWWCYSCNIPTLQSECPRCRGKAKRVLLSDPGDARPAFERDYQFLYRAYAYEFGTLKGLSDIIGRSVALLNKAPYYDEMKEVIADGIQIGRLFFDPLLRSWRFRLSRYSATKLYTSYPDVLEIVRVDRRYYTYSDIVRVDKDVVPGKQVVFVDSLGKVVGIGYSKGRGRIMVHSWWGAREENSAKSFIEVYRRSSLDDVINAHREYIGILSARAKKFIAITYEKVRKPIIVSFSGGKDSLVSLHLTLDLDPFVLFNNTGIELPETVSTVYSVADRYGLELVEASAGNRFWSAVYELGVPGRDYRWCCKVCKLAPLALTVKRLWGEGGLNVVGQRAFESIDRARSPSLWRLRWAPTLLNLSPINEWSQFEVWLYIFMHSLEANPLYLMGYERIGCFMCPASTMAELELVSQTHEDLWKRWLDVLDYWAKRLDLPREWIEYGLWRWNAPARYRTMIARRLRIDKRIDDWLTTFKAAVNPKIEGIKLGEGSVEVTLGEAIDIDCIESQIAALSPLSHLIDSNGALEIRWDNAVLQIKGNRIEMHLGEAKAIERMIDVFKVLYRWNLCTGCRSCEAICTSGAATLKTVGGRPRPVVDGSKCIGCRFCIYNCPVAEVYVEHIVAPVILGDPEAWRRETKEHHDEVLDKIRKFIRSRMPPAEPSRTYRQESPVDVSQFFDIGEGGARS